MCVPRTVARTAVLGQCAHVRCFIRPLTRYRQLSRTQNNFCSAFFVVVDVSFFFCCCSSTSFNALIPVYMFLPCSNVSYEDAMMVVKSARGHVWRNGRYRSSFIWVLLAWRLWKVSSNPSHTDIVNRSNFFRLVHAQVLVLFIFIHRRCCRSINYEITNRWQWHLLIFS